LDVIVCAQENNFSVTNSKNFVTNFLFCKFATKPVFVKTGGSLYPAKMRKKIVRIAPDEAEVLSLDS